MRQDFIIYICIFMAFALFRVNCRSAFFKSLPDTHKPWHATPHGCREAGREPGCCTTRCPNSSCTRVSDFSSGHLRSQRGLGPFPRAELCMNPMDLGCQGAHLAACQLPPCQGQEEPSDHVAQCLACRLVTRLPLWQISVGWQEGFEP